MNNDMLLDQQVQQQEENMSNSTSDSGDQTSVSSGKLTEASGSNYLPLVQEQQQQFFDPESQPQKKKRNPPRNPDPKSEVIALSPKTLLMSTNRFVCEICNKGFQRDQNLQLHRRGHNLSWKLKERSNREVIIRRKVYVCPEESCVHHDPSRALGDLTGIKKHFSRKHGEKKWKCDKCSKKFAGQSDCKAHSKICGTREYKCDCGTLFSRRDSFVTHRAFCEALAKEIVIPQNKSHQQSSSSNNIINNGTNNINDLVHTFPMKKELQQSSDLRIPPWFVHQPVDLTFSNPNPSNGEGGGGLFSVASPHMSATALLQKAVQMGSIMTPPLSSTTDSERSTHYNNLSTKMAAMMISPSGFLTSKNNHNNQGLFQDYSAAGFDNHSGEVAFEDTFDGFLRTKAGSDKNKSTGSGEGGESLTRDFFGLSFADIENCINGSTSSDQLHSKPRKG